MEIYKGFAKAYDTFMGEIPYEKWSQNLVKILKKNGISEGLLLELGCGTGTMTELLAKEGFDMTGVDVSVEMLNEAMKKRDESGLSILYLNQDIREFELYGTMAGIVSVCDTMNYLLNEEEFIRTLKLVNNYLDPKGIFVFDLKTEYYYKNVLGEQTYADTEEDAAYIWENYYDEEERLNVYQLTLFEKNETGSFDRYLEEHEQKAYDLYQVREMAKEAGLEFVEAVDEGLGPVRENSERVYIVLREKGK